MKKTLNTLIMIDDIKIIWIEKRQKEIEMKWYSDKYAISNKKQEENVRTNAKSNSPVGLIE